MAREWQESDGLRQHDLVDADTGRILGSVRVLDLQNNTRDPALPSHGQEFNATDKNVRHVGTFRTLHDARRAVEDTLGE